MCRRWPATTWLGLALGLLCWALGMGGEGAFLGRRGLRPPPGLRGEALPGLRRADVRPRAALFTQYGDEAAVAASLP